jgi:long-subunit fatty acid transport protein
VPGRSKQPRSVRLPDTNRIWVGLGEGYAYSDAISLEIAYAHVFFEDG